MANPPAYDNRLQYVITHFLTPTTPLGASLPPPPSPSPHHTCPICYDPILPTQPTYSHCPHALHPLHRTCALRWLSTYHPDLTHYASACPVCRTPFYISPAEAEPAEELTALRAASDETWAKARELVRLERAVWVLEGGQDAGFVDGMRDRAMRNGRGVVQWWMVLAEGAETWLWVAESAVWLTDSVEEARGHVDAAAAFLQGLKLGSINEEGL